MDSFKNITQFLNHNKNKDVVVVQGLGFVGAVMSIVCANSSTDYAVIGVDVKENEEIINNINKGKFHIKSSDPKVEKYFIESMRRKNFYATYDPVAYSFASTIIVDINLDVQKESDKDGNLISYDVNLNPFKQAIKTIGKHCKKDALILVETTVPPGTCDKVVKPTLKEELEKRNLSSEKIKIGHSYERVMPGPDYVDSIKNFYRVYSGINKQSADETELFLKTIISTENYPLTRLINTNATEMAKVLENSYRAMNIAFAVEWSRYAEEANVNLYELVDAIRMRPTHSNLMYPGIGVGGYCLTKDPLLASWARVNNFNGAENLVQSENGVKINDKMPHFAFEFMLNSFNLRTINNLKILLLGVSYRSDVGDTRYSPVEPFYKNCKKNNAIIDLHDPFVDYWDELNLNVCNDLNKLLSSSSSWNIIVISTAHSIYSTDEVINKISSFKNIMVYDTVGLLSERQINLIKNNNNVIKVLGRGDL